MKHPLSPYKAHVEEWKNCDRCFLAECRKHVVLARGQIPCDVLFVGEAPGESEDVVGKPFVGPAGKLLDHIVWKALPDGTRVLFTNLVGCIPREEVDEPEVSPISPGNAENNSVPRRRVFAGKAGQPEDESIVACQPRLVGLIGIAKPKLIVCVGALARDWFDQGYKHSIKVPDMPPHIDVTHPAAILRASVVMKGLMVQRCVVNISNAWEDAR